MNAADIEGIELSPKKADYIKYLSGVRHAVRTSDLAARFGVDPSTVTKTMNELSELGLVLHVPYRGVRLTERGRKYASFLVRRHLVLSLIFTQYGLRGEEACREVSRFECYVSRDTIDRICRSLGHPHHSFCGGIMHDRDCPGASGEGSRAYMDE